MLSQIIPIQRSNSVSSKVNCHINLPATHRSSKLLFPLQVFQLKCYSSQELCMSLHLILITFMWMSCRVRADTHTDLMKALFRSVVLVHSMFSEVKLAIICISAHCNIKLAIWKNKEVGRSNCDRHYGINFCVEWIWSVCKPSCR